MTASRCPLCAHPTAAEIAASGEARLVRCGACTLAYSDPPPRMDIIHGAYERLYGHDLAVARVAGRRLAVFSDFFERVPPSGEARLLDVGCGTGDFLLLARERGWQPTGIDVAERAAARARERGLDARTDWNGLPSETFAAVTLWNVVEFVQRPLEMLADVKRVLVPGGRVFVRTPNERFQLAAYRLRRRIAWCTPLARLLGDAYYFAARFNEAIASYKQAARLQPPVVSMERIRDEFSKLLVAEQVQRGLELLDATRLLPRIVPQLEVGKGMQQGGWHSHDVFGHSLLTASLAPPELITRLAALVHDVGKPAVHELKDGKPTFIGHQEIGAGMAGVALRHLRYPGDVTDAVVKLVRLHMRPIQYDPHGWEDKAVRRLVRDAGDQLQRLLALARADMRASHYPGVTKIDDLEARIRRLDADAIAAIRSPLTGEDLMARTGRPAGPWIKRVKAALEDAIIDGTLAPDAQAAWRYLEAHPELLEP